MSAGNIDFKLKRLKFIEACAYYLMIKQIGLDRLEMNEELADLISERFRSAELSWAIGGMKRYTNILVDGLTEFLPDIGDRAVNMENVLRYSFRSMVTKQIEDKKRLIKSHKPAPNVDANANVVLNAAPAQPADQPSATPHDFLIGFTVHIKPDAHLDEMVPICARDQHLLFNIFGDQWKSPVVINAYKTVKGQTGFMGNWSSNQNGYHTTEMHHH